MTENESIPVPEQPTPEEAAAVNAALDRRQHWLEARYLAEKCFVAAMGAVVARDYVVTFESLAHDAFAAADAFLAEAARRHVPYPKFTGSDH
jgi:hypothetical protein